MMGEETQPRLDTWDDFAGEYIKAEFIKQFPAKLPVINLHGSNEDGKNKLICDVEFNKRKWKFDLNRTNQNFLRNNGIKTPAELIGRILIVDKIKVRSPLTNSMVDSLIINKIE